MKQVSLLFVHGWGFDAGLWTPMRDALAGVSAATIDLGYFGAAHVPEVPPPVLVIGHSLGALLALRSPPPGCIGLVAINGFDRFTGEAGVAPRILDRMIARLEAAPDEVVAEFRRRCGSSTSFDTPDRKRLADHLRLMRDADERATSAAWDRPLLVLQGEQDPILPAGLRAIAFADAPMRRLERHAEGGHLLPVSHPRWCAEHIKALESALMGALP